MTLSRLLCCYYSLCLELYVVCYHSLNSDPFVVILSIKIILESLQLRPLNPSDKISNAFSKYYSSFMLQSELSSIEQSAEIMLLVCFA